MGGGECCVWRKQRKTWTRGHAGHFDADRMSAVLWVLEIERTFSLASEPVAEDRTR